MTPEPERTIRAHHLDFFSKAHMHGAAYEALVITDAAIKQLAGDGADYVGIRGVHAQKFRNGLQRTFTDVLSAPPESTVLISRRKKDGMCSASSPGNHCNNDLCHDGTKLLWLARYCQKKQIPFTPSPRGIILTTENLLKIFSLDPF